MAEEPRKISDLTEHTAPLAGTDKELAWLTPDEKPFRLSGFPWYDDNGLFRRLPVNSADKFREAVDNLADCTAGGQVSFRSDTSEIAISVELAGPAGMCHMPATGQCGFDLYTGAPFNQRFHNTAKFDHTELSYEVLLFKHPEREMRNFTLNFPLYQGVKQVRIGLAPESHVQAPLPRTEDGRIVVYGTSITQGGCASRPGMAYTNILSRMLNMEFINLGFSRNGRGDPEVIEATARIPSPALFVLDYEANSVNFDTYERTLPEAISILRKDNQNTPILVLSRITYAGEFTHLEARESAQRNRAMQAKLVRDLREKGDENVHFVDGSDLLGQDADECTVDGAHPNDLGFMRMAQNLAGPIGDILGIAER
ncbi:MAG: SGNH/GDSL hydrolase family protein [Candidatus Brocadiia bacterium]